MKHFLKKTGYSLLGLLVLVVIVAFLLPSQSHIEVSTKIDAPIQTVFDKVNDLRNWESWSPWKTMDPLMEMSFSNPPAGKGAFLNWHSDVAKIGSGKLTLAEVVPQQRVLIVMDSDQSRDHTSQMTFQEVRGKVRVTWSTDISLGRNPLLRYNGLFRRGAMRNLFETGLQSLKKNTEPQ